MFIFALKIEKIFIFYLRKEVTELNTIHFMFCSLILNVCVLHPTSNFVIELQSLYYQK
jgi:hypothetical protein